ncbi:MAG: hypothetical protein V5A49_00870 [Haloarcula sp.]
MSEKKLSLFELHFHDTVQFGPRTIDGLGGSRDEEAIDETGDSATDTGDSAATGEEQPDESQTDDGGRSVVRPLVGLGMLAAAAYVVRKLLSGEPNGLDALDEIETGAEDADSEDIDSEEAVSIEVTSGEESPSGPNGLVAAAIVALLVVLALVARKLLADTAEKIEAPDELAEE